MGARGRKSSSELSIVRPGYEPHRVGVVTMPRTLGDAGKAQWRSITGEYQISAAGDVALLTLICESQDTLAACRARIAREGAVTDGGREHPLLKIELQTRAFIARGLRQLGLENS